MSTVFRTTAILPDNSGRYRTWLSPASTYHNKDNHRADWSDASIEAHIKAQPLPTAAIQVTEAEWDDIHSNWNNRGYVDAPGDLTSDFIRIKEWK